MEIPADLYTHIARKHGEMASLLAKIRDMQSDLAALDAQTLQSVRITVLAVNAQQFSMLVPVATLREIIESDLRTHSRKLAAAASVPFDWMHEVIDVVPASPPIASPNGESSHG